jgi:hypothetical protein
MKDAKYVRVYYSVIDDPKFEHVIDDVAVFGTWVRLLLNADAVWPASADIPRWVKASAIRVLSGAELVDIMPGHRYRIHGLDAERNRRSNAASNAAALRWHRNGNAETMPSQAKPSKDEQSQAEQSRDPADAYWSLTGRYPKDRTLSWIDDLTEKHGAEAVIKALTEAHIEDATVATLLGRTGDILSRKARELDRREADEERARLKEKRAKPRVMEPWQEEFRRKLEEDSAA